jgi:Protein of unknown function (DUF3168)
VTVDAERLTAAWLRARPDIMAIVEDRVVTVVPNRAVTPFLKVTQIAGSPRYSRPLFLDEAYLQIDAYGGPKALARQLIDITRDALANEFVGDHPGVGVVTCVNFGDLSYIPDDTYEPPQPRWIAMASVYTRP